MVEKEVQPVRLGVIGVGNMGSSHIKSHAEGKHHEIRITACADIIPERAEKMKEYLPHIKTFDSAEALIDSGEVDAVLIATPHYFHPPIAEYAFSKGLHVLTEKPAGVHAPDTDDWAVEQGWISLCPLQVDQTDDEELERLSAGAEAR